MSKISIKLIKKIDSQGKFIYSDAFNLSSINDIRKATFSSYVDGFLIEKEEGNTSLPILEVIHAEDRENEFKIDKFHYHKSFYQIPKDSVLEVKNLLLEILIEFTCESEREFLESIDSILEEYHSRKIKKLSKFQELWAKKKKMK